MSTKAWLTALPDLTTVDEDVAIEEQLQADFDDAEQEIAEEVGGHERRISAHSGMSGTTAKTSFSQEEIADLDRDVMVDVLPNLAAAADELSRLLVPADPKSGPIVRKEIRTTGTKHQKLYTNRLASLNVHKDSFGSTEYLQPSNIVRALLGVQDTKDVPEGPWRPDAIIYKINLASMLRSTLIEVYDNAELTQEGFNAVETLDVHFASSIAGPQFSQNAFELLLALLTQLALIRAVAFLHDPNYLPRLLITRTFYAPAPDGSHAFTHAKVLHMTNLPEDQHSALASTVQDTVNHLVSAFDDSNPESWRASLHALQAQYPWDQFVGQVLRYYEHRKQVLDAQIADIGGMDQIMIGLAEEVQRREDGRIAEVKRQSYSRPGGTPKKAFAKGAIQKLKAMQKRSSEDAASPAATAPVAQMTAPTASPLKPATAPQQVQDDGWNPVEDNEQHAQQTVPASNVRSTLAALSGLQATQRQNAAKGKGRSLIDRQEGAHRVEFEDSQQTQYEAPGEFRYPTSSAAPQGPYYQSPRAAKRPHENDPEDEDFDPTQDEGFQVDTRDTAAADQRRLAAPQATAAPRFSTAGPASATASPSRGNNLFITGRTPTPSPSKRSRRNPGSSIPAPPAPFDPDDEEAEIPREQRMERAKIAARHGTIMATQTKPQQIRKPWSNDEEMALIDLIENECDDGISYSKLKTLDASRHEGAELGKRSAEDFRFKARNMKETFLKYAIYPGC